MQFSLSFFPRLAAGVLLVGIAVPAWASYTLEHSGSYVARSIEITGASGFDEGKFKHIFTNTGPDSTDFSMYITTAYSGTDADGHSWTMCTTNACVSPGVVDQIRLAPAESDTVTIKVYSLTESGSSSTTLIFEELSGATTEFRYGVVSSGTEVIIVDDSASEGTGGHLATGAAATGMSYGVFDATIVGIGDSNVDLSLADVVVYTSGVQSSDILSSADVSMLSAYLDDGGTLLMSGQDLIDDLTGSNFASDYLGVVGFGSSSSTSVTGVAGDPVGSGLTFDLTAGSAPAVNPTHLGGSTAFLRYADGEPAGIRNNPTSAYNAYSLGFGVESLSAADLSTLITAISTAGSSVPIEHRSWSNIKASFGE